MFKKILSIFLCLVCVFTVCIVSEVKSQAIFVVDDAVMLGIAISVCASIALSVGLGVASGQGSVYADVAEYILYHLPSDMYNYVMDESNYQIINGKLTLVFTKSMWDRFKNWFANTDLSTIPLSAHLGSVTLDGALPAQSTYNGYGYNPNYNDYFAACEAPWRPLDYTFNGIYVSWLPTGKLTIQLQDGTVVSYDDVFPPRDTGHANVVGLSVPTVRGSVNLMSGYHYPHITNNLGSLPAKTNIDRWQNGIGRSMVGFDGALVTLPDGTTGTMSYNYNNGAVSFNDTVICTGNNSKNDYSLNCLKAGSILANVSTSNGNNYFPVNTNGSVTDYTKDIDTKPVATAIPRNSSIENDEVLVLPIRSNLVDPDNPAVPLTKSQVKNREKEGLPISSTIPAVPNMSTETGKDQGITIIAGRDVIDDTPVYNPAYPSVINPGNETITVTANNDVFPTQANPGETTAFPQEAESAIVKSGEIVSDIAKDLVTPLTPDDIAKGGNRMKLPTLLLQKFPFCIPYDLYNAFGVLLAEPEAPNFDWPIKLDSVGINTNIHIDFSKYEDGAKYIRWFLMALWTVALIMLTRKVIWK